MLLVHHQLQNNPVVLKLNNKDRSELPFLLQKHHMQLLALMITDPNQYLGMLLNIYRDIENNNYKSVTQVLERGMFNDEKISFK